MCRENSRENRKGCIAGRPFAFPNNSKRPSASRSTINFSARTHSINRPSLSFFPRSTARAVNNFSWCKTSPCTLLLGLVSPEKMTWPRKRSRRMLRKPCMPDGEIECSLTRTHLCGAASAHG